MLAFKIALIIKLFGEPVPIKIIGVGEAVPSVKHYLSTLLFQTLSCSVSPLKNNWHEEVHTKDKVIREQQPNKTTWKNLIHDFASSSTAHGIGRIAAGDTYFKRGAWVILCLGVYTTLFWLCSTLIVTFKNKPVITKMEVSFEEVRDHDS